MSHDVFICYSSRDKTIATAMCAVLEAEGVRCWMAPRDIVPGADWGESIIDAINDAKAMVLVFSSHANDAQQQIKREIERAVNKGIPVVPFRIENVMPTKALEYFLSTPHWLDAFTPPLDDHVRQLADSIKRLLGKQAAQRPNLTSAPPHMPSLPHHLRDVKPVAAADFASFVEWAKKPVHAGILGAAALVLIGLLWWMFKPTATPADQEAWNVAAMQDAIPAYQLYMREEPQGYYSSQATSRMAEIKAEVDDAFAKAKQANTATAWQNFINTYGKQGLDLDEARDAYANADQAEATARTAYRTALQYRSREAYQNFLAQFATSAYAADVKQRLAQCHTQTQTNGGVQSTQMARTATGDNANPTNACVIARNNAASAAQNACTGTGGRVGGESVLAQNVRNAQSTGGQVVGSLLGGAIFGNRNVNVAANYECSVEVGIACQKTVTSSRQVDVCP
jgi:hypothetical protein